MIAISGDAGPNSWRSVAGAAGIFLDKQQWYLS
ncbi:hypothetical protein MESS4_740006 [Mesorhizobium sp. STM 4661]|nr:hypothetical protein MESS4_740006 [Mesorhizobium sp. STM 4661]